MTENGTANKYKRKRKKSFLKNARKYAKKGCYGRGSQLEPDLYQYFVRIMEAYREGFESEEDKIVFIKNVFGQTEGHEIEICCNQVGCRVIETLIPFASAEVIDKFVKALANDLRPLCSDRYASHVLEALVIKTTTTYFNPDIDESTKESSKEFALKISKFLLNNLEDFVWDTYGNHIIRTCLESLAQVPKEDSKKGRPSNAIKTEETNIELPSEFSEVIQDYGERILNWPQFIELTKTEIPSAFLQTLLRCLKKVDKKLLRKYLKKLLDECFDPDSKPENTVQENILKPVFLSKSLIMLLETALQVAKSKLFTQIYARCFIGRLVKLATVKNTNFTVQKLIAHCREKNEFESIFDELKDNFEDIIKSENTAIIWGLASGCKTFSTKQGIFVQNTLKILECSEPEERQNQIVPCLAKFIPFSALKPDLSKDLNLHGVLTIQLILDFNKPIKIVNSLLNIDTGELVKLFCSPMGCHVSDSYMKSTFVGEKSRERLVKKLKGSFPTLASCKYGSRSFDTIWKNSSVQFKISIIEDLARKENEWSQSENGKFIAKHIKFDLFKKNKANWKNSLNAKSAQELFADMLK